MQLTAYVWRLQYALKLPDERYFGTRFDVLEQYAYARGEEVIMNRYHQAESVNVAINHSLSDKNMLKDYMGDLQGLINEYEDLTKEDILEHNSMMAAQARQELTDG